MLKITVNILQVKIIIIHFINNFKYPHKAVITYVYLILHNYTVFLIIDITLLTFKFTVQLGN